MNSDTNDIHEIERRLKTARERLERAMSNVTLKHDSPEWQEYDLAKQEVLRLERLRAAATGDEYAETIEFPARWDIGAPLPHLFVSDDRAFLAFLLAEYDPEWDGTYVTAKSPAGNEPENLALVEFEYCVSAKLGGPNDEVFSGHPLHGKGLEAYAAQRVINSRWLKEIETINSVHPQYRPTMSRDVQHFIFWFHDSTFECLARSFTVEVHRIRMKDLLNQMVDRLIS
jgi:hypothetical protein